MPRDFYRYNYDVVLVDYRGFGKSTGKRSEKEMLNDMQFVYETLTETISRTTYDCLWKKYRQWFCRQNRI